MNRILLLIFVLGHSIMIFGQNKIEMSVLIDFDNAETPLVNSDISITNLHSDKAIVIEDVEFINQMPDTKNRHKVFCIDLSRMSKYKKADCKCCSHSDHTYCRYFLLPNQTLHLERFLRIDKKMECLIKWREINVQDVENYVCVINPIVPPKKKQIKPKTGSPGTPGSQGNPSPQMLIYIKNWGLYRILNDSVQNYYQDIGFKNVAVKHFEKFQVFTDTIELEIDEQSNFSNCGISEHVSRPDYQRFSDKFSCSESIVNHNLEELKCFELNNEIVISYNIDTNFVFLKKDNRLIPIAQPKITTDAIDYLQQLKEQKKGIYIPLNKNYFDDVIEVVKAKDDFKENRSSYSIKQYKLNTDEFVEVLKSAKENNLTLYLKLYRGRGTYYHLSFR